MGLDLDRLNGAEASTPRRPLVLLVLAAAIPVVLFAAWAVFLNARQVRTEEKAAALETLDRVVTRVASELNAQIDIAETLASSSALDTPDLEKFYLEAHRVNQAHPLWETIALIDPQGNQMLNLLRPMGEDLPATTDMANLKKVLDTKKSAIGGIGPVGRVSGKRLIAFRAPAVRNGKIKYVVTISLVPDAVSQILRAAGAPRGWVGVVVDANGEVVARTIAERFELGSTASESVREAIKQGSEGSYIARTPDGGEVDTIFRSLPGTSGWSVHFGILSDELNAPVRRSVVFLATGGAVSIALGLALALFTARDIAQRRRDQEEKAELALRLSEERRTLAIDAADLGVVSWNFSTGEVQADKRTRELLGLPELNLEHDITFGASIFLDRIHPEDRVSVERSFRQSADIAVAMEFRTTLPGTPWRRVYARAPRMNLDGPQVTFGIVMDIDAAKRAEIVRIELLRRLSDAEESERRRIAIELHDQIGQTVTGLSLGLKNLEQSLLASNAGTTGLEKIQWLQSLAGTISRDIHQVASDLRPTALDDVGLYEALTAFCSEWSRRFGIKADVQTLGDLAHLPAAKEIAIYRIVQEALNNVVKHADATSVSIVIDRRPLELRVIVEDNGVGFDTQEARTGGFQGGRMKLGLSGIEERLALIGGSLTIESERDAGTTLFIFVPLSLETEYA